MAYANQMDKSSTISLAKILRIIMAIEIIIKTIVILTKYKKKRSQHLFFVISMNNQTYWHEYGFNF